MKLTFTSDNISQAMAKLSYGEEEAIQFDADDILQIHDVVIQEFGGLNGIRDYALFESVCVTPYQEIFGTELYPTIFDKAAKYMFDFANYQIFVDGNKRTGLAVCDAFLAANGFDLQMPAEQLYFLVMDIAEHKIDQIEDIASCLRAECKFLDMTNDINVEKENDYEERT